MLYEKDFINITISRRGIYNSGAEFGSCEWYASAKKSAEAISGALVTFTSEWDSDLKYQQKVNADGFRVVLPQGGYILTIVAEGYETFQQEIDVDEPNIDLDLIIMLTTEQAAERDARRKKRAQR